MVIEQAIGSAKEMKMMKDIDIRQSFRYKLFRENDRALIIDEMTICEGDSRIDIAVINSEMNGFEIKSESDTLERLPKQMEYYNKVFDTVTIITTAKYIDETIDIVPNWWGIVYAEMDKDCNVYFCDIRKAEKNNIIDPLSVAQLLWRDEALNILKKRGLQKGLLSKPKRVLWEYLAEHIPLSELCYEVRESLKNRSNWRVR